MNALLNLLVVLLRCVGALGGVVAAIYLPEAMLHQAVAAIGLDGTLDPKLARLGAHAIGGVLGFVLMSQVTALFARRSAVPPGTRREAAESVPRLRRHLMDQEGRQQTSAVPRYLDPDPAPVKPVAVSFKELGLEHPQVSEYPDPAARAPSGRDFDLREDQDRPQSAGSAMDEWGDAPGLSREIPARSDEPAVAEIINDSQEAHAAPETDFAYDAARPGQGAESAQSGYRLPESVFGPDVPDLDVALTSEPSGIAGEFEQPSSPSPEPATRSDHVRSESPPLGNPGRSIALPPAPETHAAPNGPGFAKPADSVIAHSGDSNWYAGAGDEEEDAEDDGAGYGSLSDIGLGRTHAPRGGQGQPGEAGLPPPKYESALPGSANPQGKPQDFRLREALAELKNLNEVAA